MKWIVNAISEKNDWRDNLFYGLLLLLIIAIPTSVALTSVIVGLLAINLVLTFDLKKKIEKLKNQKQILLLTTVFFIFILYLPFTSNWEYAAYELRKMAFWTAIPLSIAAYKPLSKNRFHLLILVLVITSFVASLVSILKMHIIVDSAVGNFRDVTWITHIRFSLVLIFSICACVDWLVTKNIRFSGRIAKLLLLVLIVFFIYTLLVLKSFIGYVVIVGVVIYSILFFTAGGKIKHPKFSFIIIGAFVLIPIIILGVSIHRFYTIQEYDSTTIDRYTKNGNKYTHDFTGKMVENGNYVYLFLCKKELENEWAKKRPTMPFYGKDNAGNDLEYTLYRYMTSKGLRKDSLGFQSLTNADIDNICEGIPNVIYARSQFSIYPRIYETIWEVDQYLKEPNPKDKSLAMRFELLKVGFGAWKSNPILGVGTGNAPQAMKNAHEEGGFIGGYSGIVSSHNQYLNFLIKFGIVGFIWIFYTIYRPIVNGNMRKNYLFLNLLVVFTIANFGDANFEDHSGIIFFVTLYSVLMVNRISVRVNVSNLAS